MNRIMNVTRLHLNKPTVAFGVPLMIIGLVLVITWIIAAILQRAGLDPLDPGYAESSRAGNQGMLWSMPGFLIYLGVQAIATTFPFALALGTTRRSYVVGTALANLVQAAYITLIMAVLLAIELATNHWFFGAYALDTWGLGSGSFAVLIPTVFIGVFVCLSLGGVFGAVWVRWGSKGPTVLALALGLVLVTTLLILAPQIGDIVAGITRFRVALFAIAIAVLALIGTWFCMRRTAVR
ncbi:MAG: hypothetical protein ACTHZ9_02205 [Leucobacter sp.]